MKYLLLLMILMGSPSAFSQAVGQWYEVQSIGYQDPHIFAFGDPRPGGFITFLTPDRGGPAFLVVATDRAPLFTVAELGPQAKFVLTGLIDILPAALFSSGVELFVRIPIPDDPSFVGETFNFQYVTFVNNAWKTSYGIEVTILP